MTAPFSILSLSGRDQWQRPGSGEAAVILIDAQNEYLSGPLALEGIEGALKEISALREIARREGWPVVHVRHQGQAGGPFDLEAPRGAFIEAVAPADGETVVTKTFADAFAGTDLKAQLEKTGVSRVIVAGFMTHNCVSSTVRRAVVEGYGVAIVASATATRALPLLGRAFSAAEVQTASLAALGDAHAVILADTEKL